MVDEKGEPLPGVRVILHGGVATRFRGQEATTDEKGEYAFDPLETGAGIGNGRGGFDIMVGVTIEHPTHASKDGFNWWDVIVANEEGKVTRRDFALVPGGALSGVVLDGEGRPRAGLALRVYLDGEARFFNRYATTDAEGRFEEKGLFPGTYVVDVNEPRADYPVLGRIEVAAGAEARVSLRRP